MSSSPSNNEEEDARVVQEDPRREEAEEVTMEEGEENSFGVPSPASERGTLASISTHPNPHQAMRSSNNQESLKVHEGLPQRRPLHRLYHNNFHNLIHNYGFENTPRVHIPSDWDISRPRESNVGTNPRGPENKHIMVDVRKIPSYFIKPFGRFKD